MEHASSHKCIKEYTYKWNNSHRTTTEHREKISNMWKDKKDHHNYVGQQENKKEETRLDVHPWRELYKKVGKFPHSENLPHWQADQLGQKRSSEAQRGQHSICVRQNRQRPTQNHMPLLCAPQLPPGEGSHANCHLSRP